MQGAKFVLSIRKDSVIRTMKSQKVTWCLRKKKKLESKNHHLEFENDVWGCIGPCSCDIFSSRICSEACHGRIVSRIML